MTKRSTFNHTNLTAFEASALFVIIIFSIIIVFNPYLFVNTFTTVTTTRTLNTKMFLFKYELRIDVGNPHNQITFSIHINDSFAMGELTVNNRDLTLKNIDIGKNSKVIEHMDEYHIFTNKPIIVYSFGISENNIIEALYINADGTGWLYNDNKNHSIDLVNSPDHVKSLMNLQISKLF